MITLLLAEDHAMVREGLRLALEREPDMTVVAEAGDGANAVETALRLQPTVVLLDVGLPEMDGLEALMWIKAKAPTVKVVMMTALGDERYLQRALRDGASGYVLKGDTTATLIAAVRTVARGGRAFAGAVLADERDMAPEHGQAASQEPRDSTLSVRERQVLRLVAYGHSNSDIAARLGVSPKTADTHRSRLMDKLALHTRAELTHYAHQQGFVIAPA